ncbi:division/cell wall cluster transcriptional repressor MraZ [Paracoccaceae bacterium]|nr:division/cell wall cluster transcriptional repressor MraZ [Paracoccaceae bacterium]
MIKRFRGESLHKVDTKGRVSVPAAFRRVIEEGDPDFTGGSYPNFVVVYGGVRGNCLEGYTISAISKVDILISKMPRFSRDREILERFINTQSTYMQLDETGRIVLSSRLKDKIGIKDEAIFAGMGEKFQIWEPKNYQNEVDDLDLSFKNLSEDENPFLKLDKLQD